MARGGLAVPYVRAPNEGFLGPRMALSPLQQLAQPVAHIPSTRTRTYGVVDVGILVDTLDPRFRRGGESGDTAFA